MQISHFLGYVGTIHILSNVVYTFAMKVDRPDSSEVNRSISAVIKDFSVISTHNLYFLCKVIVVAPVITVTFASTAISSWLPCSKDKSKQRASASLSMMLPAFVPDAIRRDNSAILANHSFHASRTVDYGGPSFNTASARCEKQFGLPWRPITLERLLLQAV